MLIKLLVADDGVTTKMALPLVFHWLSFESFQSLAWLNEKTGPGLEA
jgi:hypothetical protein